MLEVLGRTRKLESPVERSDAIAEVIKVAPYHGTTNHQFSIESVGITRARVSIDTIMVSLLDPVGSPDTKTEHPSYSTFPSSDDYLRPVKLSKDAPETASFWSRILFSYADPLMRAGNLRQLDNDDLWELEDKNRSATAFSEFVAHYERCNKSIIKAVISTYGGKFLLCELATLFSMACSVFAPVVLNRVVTLFAAPEIDMYTLTALKALLFKKALRRNIQNKGEANEVDIPNLFSSDVDNVLEATFQISSLRVIPIQIAIVIFTLYTVIGLAAFVGLSLVLLSLVCSYLIAGISGSAFEDLMTRMDDRMRIVKETFSVIQIVKLNAWEDKFAEKISKFRATDCQL